ncbi:MAG: hypothetical protein Q4G09_03400 [Clostridia bacterium]|nr:hypothetical protein [Clostridia bacterium]
MENIKIKTFYDKMSKESKRILTAIIKDNLVYLDWNKLIPHKSLNKIVSIYFLLIEYEYKNIIEFDNLNVKEKKMLFNIILDGIASIYVDNEYLEHSDIGTKYKQKIIQELLSFFKFISKFSKEKIFMLYEIEVKKYKRKKFRWDSNL